MQAEGLRLLVENDLLGIFGQIFHVKFAPRLDLPQVGLPDRQQQLDSIRRSCRRMHLRQQFHGINPANTRLHFPHRSSFQDNRLGSYRLAKTQP